MPVPKTGPISLKQVRTELFKDAPSAISMNATEMREAVMNKDQPSSMNAYRGVPAGQYKDRVLSNNTNLLGYTCLTEIGISNSRPENRRPVSAYNLNNGLNYDPWEDLSYNQFTSFANKWSATNFNFCFTETRSDVDYEYSFGLGQGTTSNSGPQGCYVVVNSYPNNNFKGTPVTLLNKELRTGNPGSAIVEYSGIFSKNIAYRDHIIFSVQLIMGVINTSNIYMDGGVQGLRIREL